MGDEDDAHIVGGRFLQEHVPDLRLREGVEHRRDLVGNEVARPGGKRASDAEALQLAAGESAGDAAEASANLPNVGVFFGGTVE